MIIRVRCIILLVMVSQTITFTQVENVELLQGNSRASDSLNLVLFALETRCDLWKVGWDFDEPINEWYGVELNDFGRVFCIDLDGVDDCRSTKYGGNHLHGTLPELNLPFLEHLFLSSNQISGDLPSFDGSPYLLTLQLSGNKFEGKIPSFSKQTRLTKLDLEYNNLTGRIPEFNSPDLESIYLGYNNLYGYLPSFEKSTKLKHIYVNNNKLSGGLPHFTHLIQLQQFIFNHNFFEGPLPEYFKLNELEVLDGQKNRLEGCYNESNYSELFILNMEENTLDICDLEDLSVPTAFSPNGDRVNDLFNIEGKNNLRLSEIRLALMVSDLKGRLVYTNDDYQGEWDGTYMGNGKHLPEGLYMVQLKYRSSNYKGTVYIRR